MRKFLTTVLLLCGAAQPGLAADPSVNSLELEARELAQRFVGQLKPRLKGAMEQGGPALAVEVCASAAPRIADALSAESGWQVSRVSLKSRNASRAVPDKWEQSVLQEFERRQAAGEAPATLSHGEVIGGSYRYLQAQGVQPLCLTCHGQVLADPVKEVLGEYYPDDLATGYTLGQVRGAISLAKPL